MGLSSRGFLLIIAILITIGRPLPAQTTRPADLIRVSLITVGTGDAVYERFGHNAIRIVDESRGVDFSCNWGMFDFDQPGFVRRFCFGDMVYWMAPLDTAKMIDAYKRDNRSVWEQELNLTAAQKQALYDFVLWNYREENREYRYDYYRDNCSTRVRDALDKAAGGEIYAHLQGKPTGHTYRFHTRRQMADCWPYYTPLLYILGQPVDQPIDAWQESFLPSAFQAYVREVTVVDEGGNRVPLVKSERTLFDAPRPADRTAPPYWVPAYLLIGLGVAAGFYLLARRGWRKTFVTVATVWALFVGGVGSFALWAWLFTHHVAVRANENVLHFAPFALVLVYLIPAAFRGKRTRIVPAARKVCVAVAAMSLLGLVLKVLPMFSQVNWGIIALVLPVHLAVAYGVQKLLAPAPQA